MKPWSLEMQAERRREQAALIRQLLRPRLDDRAWSDKLLWWDQARMVYWASNAFFCGDATDVAFANTMLRYIRDQLKEPPGPNPFPAGSISGILATFNHLLAEDVRRFLLEYLEASLPFGLTRDYQFHGYNTNMPALWTWGLIYGGERLDNRRFREVGHANLRQLQDLLRRRGTVAEYGHGYAVTRMPPIAQLAAHSRETWVRELAQQIEARLWAELAGHWNPATAQIAGASMRGGPPISQEDPALLRQVFGDEILVRDWRRYYLETPRQFAADLGVDPDVYQLPYALCFNADFAAADYHVPDHVAELFYRKPVGFAFRCSAEIGYVNGGIYCKQIPRTGVAGTWAPSQVTKEVVVIPDYPDHGAQPHALTTYHGRHYAMGSSNLAMFTTSHPFRCTYRRPDGTLGDVFVRYNINHKVTSGRLKNRYWKSPDMPEERENYNNLYWDSGHYHCLQHANTVLCLQTPQYLEYWDIRSLRAELFFYQGQGKVGRVEQTDRLITVDEGSVFMAIHPLFGRHLDRPAPVKIFTQGEWLVISLCTYEGPSRAFTKHDLAKLGSGFVFEVCDAGDCASFAAFQEEMRQVRIIDQLYAGRRRVHYARPGLRLSTHYCPYTQTTMYDAINGRTAPAPQFEYSDGRHEALPLLDGPESPGFEDWEWLQTQTDRPIETYNPEE